jgi:hypothetical protein
MRMYGNDYFGKQLLLWSFGTRVPRLLATGTVGTGPAAQRGVAVFPVELDEPSHA